MKGQFKIKKDKQRFNGEGIVAYTEKGQIKVSLEAGLEVKAFTVRSILQSIQEENNLSEDQLKEMIADLMDWR